ncbi:ABC transporter substrate-binding protein [Paludibacterium sp. B53371]|uniref:substrate-binding periplasmic protein n=1 Tax=Paludibacterium sp. B53371 TaxID=2806263 RepID=UPI001C03E37D|nr:transporter substrate-binding domain-containing protein [Paludibacterium sp. B53371]
MAIPLPYSTKRLGGWLLLAWLLTRLGHPAWAEQLAPEVLLVLTEQQPPYSFMSGQGNIDGMGTRMTRAILEKAGLRGQFMLYPWARSLTLSRTRPNTLIYGLDRSREREKSFIWITPLATHERWIYRLRGTVPGSIRTLAQIRHQGMVCVVNDDIAEDDLRREGFVEGRSYISTNSYADCIRLVESGTVPYLVESPDSLAWELSLDWKLRSKFEAVTPLPASRHEPMYLAASPNTDPAVIARLRAAAAALKASGQLEQIRKDFSLRLNTTPSQ